MSEPEKILTTLKAVGKINNELQILHLGKPFWVVTKSHD
jgi:hypothetical protein